MNRNDPESYLCVINDRMVSRNVAKTGRLYYVEGSSAEFPSAEKAIAYAESLSPRDDAAAERSAEEPAEEAVADEAPVTLAAEAAVEAPEPDESEHEDSEESAR